MLIAVLLSLTLVLTTLIVHFQALRWTSGLLPRCGAAGPARVLVVMIGAFGAHLLEIGLYAGAFYLLDVPVAAGDVEGAHEESAMGYLYYSTVMYTSLGIGDVFPTGHLRLISAIETLNGLVLIGWSTSFTFLAMRRYWPMEESAVAR
ncbi:MAG: hypothetical protein CMN57_09725 [Gammaproteobacteria bacterium]|nr:hypothetical protein [Gammaproteobacteria bacterium]|tara:strand:+ start:27295 stop:27738 length:444 start_codon:yes stop_codon:yes gene_type:complete